MPTVTGSEPEMSDSPEGVVELFTYVVGELLPGWLDDLGCPELAGMVRGPHDLADLHEVQRLNRDLVTVAMRLRREVEDSPRPLDERAWALHEICLWLTAAAFREHAVEFGLAPADLSEEPRSGPSLHMALVALAREAAHRHLVGTHEGLLASLVGEGIPLDRARAVTAVATS